MLIPNLWPNPSSHMACMCPEIRRCYHNLAPLLRDLFPRQQAVLAHCVIHCLQSERGHLNTVQSLDESAVAVEILMCLEIEAWLKNIVIQVLQSISCFSDLDVLFELLSAHVRLHSLYYLFEAEIEIKAHNSR